MRDVFSWSFPIGKLFDITIRVHIILPLVMIGMIWRVAARKDAGGAYINDGAWIDAAMLMGLMFVSVLLHELGHCFAARRMDGEADEVLLWPLGGLAFCRSLPYTPLAHFVTALGGPAVNFALCLVSGLALSLAFDQHFQPPFDPRWYPYRWNGNEAGALNLATWSSTAEVQLTQNLPAIILARVFFVNWLLLLLNLVPGIPLDGGRMLQAGLWPRMGHFQSTKVAIYCGFGVMIFAGLLSIAYTEPLLILLALFIFVSCAHEMMALEAARDDSLFGYDFSQGYTSLEKDEPPRRVKKQNFFQRWLAQRAARKSLEEQQRREAEDRRMDELLDKIQKFGKEALTDEEHRFLKRVADRYKNKP